MKETLRSKLERLDKIAENFIGNTPLIEVTDDKREGARIFAKLEWHNILGGTIKDRGAYGMLKAALKEAEEKGKDILEVIEYTGGSQGITMSIFGSILNIPMTFVVPGALPENDAKRLALYGDRVVKTDAKLGFLGAIRKAEEMAEENSELKLFHQQRNPANLAIFENEMAGEILSQLKELGIKKAAAWTAAIGSGATLIGVYKGLKKVFSDIKLYAVSPAEMPYGTEQAPHGTPKLFGAGGLGYGLKQKFVEPFENEMADHFTYSLQEAYAKMAIYYKKTGMMIGSSSAANLMAAETIAKDLDKDEVVLTAFPSLAIQRDMENLKDYL